MRFTTFYIMSAIRIAFTVAFYATAARASWNRPKSWRWSANSTGSPIPPDPLESNVHGFAERLLRSLRDAGLESKILWPLARLIFQSAADPGCLTDFLALARKVVDAALDEPLPPAGLYGYDEWPRYSAALWTAARPFLDRELLADTQRAARLWLDDDEHTPRFHAFVGFP